MLPLQNCTALHLPPPPPPFPLPPSSLRLLSLYVYVRGWFGISGAVIVVLLVAFFFLWRLVLRCGVTARLLLCSAPSLSHPLIRLPSHGGTILFPSLLFFSRLSLPPSSPSSLPLPVLFVFLTVCVAVVV